MKRALRKDKFGTSKKRLKALLNDFYEYNKELERLTNNIEQLESSGVSSRSVFRPPLPQIRSYAKSIYDVLMRRDELPSFTLS